MKNTIFLLAIAALISLTVSCNAIKAINCRSKNTVPVVFVTKTGLMYTVNVPYCDTINLSSDKMTTGQVYLRAMKQ